MLLRNPSNTLKIKSKINNKKHKVKGKLKVFRGFTKTS